MCLKGLVLGAQPPRYPRRHHLQLLQASAQRLGDKGVPERGRGADGGWGAHRLPRAPLGGSPRGSLRSRSEGAVQPLAGVQAT